MTLIVAFGLLYVWVIGFSLWAAHDLRTFLARNPRLATQASLDEYRALARRNMYAAIVQAAVLMATIVLSVMIIVRLGLRGLVIALAGNAVTFAFGRYVGRYEKQAKALPADSEELAAAHREVTAAWGGRLLPNF